MDEGLGNRIFDFVLRFVNFCKELNHSVENKIIEGFAEPNLYVILNEAKRNEESQNW